MLEVLEPEIAIELIVSDALELRIFFVEVVDRHESIAHAHPDAPVGKNRPERPLLELHRVYVLRFARRRGNDSLADEKIKSRNQNRNQQYRDRHLEPADTELLACHPF